MAERDVAMPMRAAVARRRGDVMVSSKYNAIFRREGIDCYALLFAMDRKMTRAVRGGFGVDLLWLCCEL